MKYILLCPLTIPCFALSFIVGVMSRSIAMGWVQGYIYLANQEMQEISDQVDDLLQKELENN